MRQRDGINKADIISFTINVLPSTWGQDVSVPHNRHVKRGYFLKGDSRKAYWGAVLLIHLLRQCTHEVHKSGKMMKKNDSFLFLHKP